LLYRIALAIIIVWIAIPGARQPAHARLEIGPHGNLNLAVFTIGSLGFSALVSSAAYYMYKNSPAQRAKGYPENLGMGEWYLAGYSGLSYLPAADWKFFEFPPPFQGRTAKNIEYQPGILGGIKFGRFFDTLPWFGLELEANFSRNNIRGNQGRISPPVPGGPTNIFTGPDWFMILDMQCNLLARYGFLPDKEVPFGRLQPYVGVGPGFEVIWAKDDSAKNFAIEALSGIRYMCTQNIAVFCEYKFSYQFKVEYENFRSKQPQEGTMMFDVPHHRIVFGVSYHFKNLYGN